MKNIFKTLICVSFIFLTSCISDEEREQSKYCYQVTYNILCPDSTRLEYDGAKVICKINGKYFNECDSFAKATALSAFSCIEQHFKRINS